MSTEYERVKEIRMENKLSQAAFGNRIGISGAAISQIEKGKIGMTDQTRRSICREFGIREEWLRTGSGPMKTDLGASAELRRTLTIDDTGFKERLIALLLRLPQDEWETLERYANQLVEAGKRHDPDETEEERWEREASEEAEEFRQQRLAEKRAAAKSSEFGAGSTGTAS